MFLDDGAERKEKMGSGLPIPINPTVWEMGDLTPTFFIRFWREYDNYVG